MTEWMDVKFSEKKTNKKTRHVVFTISAFVETENCESFHQLFIHYYDFFNLILLFVLFYQVSLSYFCKSMCVTHFGSIFLCCVNKVELFFCFVFLNTGIFDISLITILQCYD